MIARALLLTAIVILTVSALPAQPACPLDQKNDPHPGKCGLYSDSNRDSLCDLSGKMQKAEAGKKKTVPLQIASNDTALSGQSEIDQAPVIETDNEPAARGPSYFIVELLLAVSLLAVGSEIWIYKKMAMYFKIQTVWNWLLLFAFVLSSITGVFFLLPVRFRASVTMNILYWHTVTALMFIYIGLYHFIRRFHSMQRGIRLWLGLDKAHQH